MSLLPLRKTNSYRLCHGLLVEELFFVNNDSICQQRDLTLLKNIHQLIRLFLGDIYREAYIVVGNTRVSELSVTEIGSHECTD